MTDMDTAERAKEQLRERYRAETGEELPGHVVENLDLLTFDTGIVEDIREKERLAERAHNPSKQRVAAVALVVGFVFGGLAIGTVAATFGTALAATVAFGAGFTLAGVAVL